MGIVNYINCKRTIKVHSNDPKVEELWFPCRSYKCIFAI